MRVTGVMLLVALWIGSAGVGQAADAPVQFKDVKVWELPDGLTVALETSGPVQYQASLIDSPPRIVIDMKGSYTASKTRWTGTPAPVKEIRGSQWKVGTARLVVELQRETAYRVDESPTGLSVVLERSRSGRAETAKLQGPTSTDIASDGPAKGVKAEGPKTAPFKPDVPAPELPKAELARPEPPPVVTVKPEPPNGTQGEPAATAAAMPRTAPAPAPKRVAQVPTPPSPAQPPPAAAQDRISSTSNGVKLITLDFKDADVVNVLRLLGAEGGRNIVVGDDVKGKVTVALRNVTWEQALDTVLEARGLQKIEKGGVIRIVSNEQLAKERELQARAEEAKRKAEIDVRTKMAEAELKEQQVQQRKLSAEAAAAEAEARGPLKEEVLRLAYADPGEVASTLQGILGLGIQPIEPCIRVSETETETKIEFRTGGGAVSGPIAEPPFSQLFGPPRTADQERTPPISISQDVLAKGLAIRAHCSTNSLFLRLYTSHLDRVKKIIRESLDIPLPQVKIEARMEILDRTALEAIGIQWGGAGAANAGRTTLVGQGFQSPLQAPGTGVSNFTPSNPNLNLGGLLPIFPDTGLPFGGNLVNLPISTLPNAGALLPAAGLAFGIVGTNFNVNLALQALSTLGKTRTLARPEIVTVENHRATMSLGEEIPYATVSSAGTQIQFKEALLKLEVIPMVIRERTDGQTQTKIKMFVVVENNSRGDVVNLGSSGSPPAINKRRARTQVLMNEGERLVIGGVTTGQDQNTIRKVPLMGDIPVVGWLFKQRELFEQGRELVVFLTPSVLKPSIAGAVPGK
jgi:type IV pilus assembly protein PilQ